MSFGVILVLILFVIAVLSFLGFIFTAARQKNETGMIHEAKRMIGVLQEMSGKPKSLPEAKERFERSLEGIWSCSRGFTSSPGDLTVAFFSDGRGILLGFSSHEVFEWRMVGHSQVELRFSPVIGDGDTYLPGPYEDSDWHGETFTVFEETDEINGDPIYGIRGLPLNQYLDFSRVLRREDTVERYVEG